MSPNVLCKTVILLVAALLSNLSYAAEEAWICANKKSDIPAGYFAIDVSADIKEIDFKDCEYPNQRVLIREITDNNFWMCNFDYVGPPAGYVVTKTNKGSTCGCRELGKTADGKIYCATIGARDLLGWPMILVRKR